MSAIHYYTLFSGIPLSEALQSFLRAEAYEYTQETHKAPSGPIAPSATGKRKVSAKVSAAHEGVIRLDAPKAKPVTPNRNARLCARTGCKHAVTGRKTYCCDACKQAAYRERKAK